MDSNFSLIEWRNQYQHQQIIWRLRLHFTIFLANYRFFWRKRFFLLLCRVCGNWTKCDEGKRGGWHLCTVNLVSMLNSFVYTFLKSLLPLPYSSLSSILSNLPSAQRFPTDLFIHSTKILAYSIFVSFFHMLSVK